MNITQIEETREIVWKYVYVEWTNAKLSQCLR